MAKRIISFDILRGWAILGNLMVHTFMIVSEIQGLAENNPAALPMEGFIFMGLIVVFGHWRGLFLLISAAVHMFIMFAKLRRGISRGVILVQELIKGLLLWAWAMMFYVFLAQWGISKQWVESGSSTINWQQIYHADQFANIAWSIMISAVLFFFLTSNEKTKKPLIMAIVFAVVGCLFIFPAPAIHEAARVFWRVDIHGNLPAQNTGFFGALGYQTWTDYFDGVGFTGTWDYIVRYRGGHLSFIGDKGWWDYPLRLIANQFVATESPLLPHFAYSAAGSILGIYISQEKKPDKKKFLSWGYGLAGASMVFGAFWLFVVEKIPDDPFMLVDFHVHPTWFTFVTIGMLMFLVLGMMHGHEFSRKVNWRRRLKWSRFSRRVGFLSLSVYSFASLQAVLRVTLSNIWITAGWTDPGFRIGLGLPTGWTFFLMGIELLMWFGILWAWEKINFAGSGEWLLVSIIKKPVLFMKLVGTILFSPLIALTFLVRRSIFLKIKEFLKEVPKLFRDFLDVKGRVIGVTPIHWVEPIQVTESKVMNGEVPASI